MAAVIVEYDVGISQKSPADYNGQTAFLVRQAALLFGVRIHFLVLVYTIVCPSATERFAIFLNPLIFL